MCLPELLTLVCERECAYLQRDDFFQLLSSKFDGRFKPPVNYYESFQALLKGLPVM